MTWLALSFVQFKGLATIGELRDWKFIASGLTTVLLWLGLAFATGCIATHILIVRDGELYERIEDSSRCDDECCQPKG